MRQIRICLGSSCYSRGNNIHLEVIRKYIAENQLEAEISFSGHLCEELCNSGPILRIDDKIYKEDSIEIGIIQDVYTERKDDNKEENDKDKERQKNSHNHYCNSNEHHKQL